ncbi:DUF971 family protein [Bryocella elongata]|uniref:DUF971 family protein n=1 Tax=Bryocella elongata TaxID=863522 RepID=A0A1H5YKR9_9BACT|nr:DUF971 domain-containing protein [Bryocella elongata]SEG23976.1 DUF971 family protein [Bryocella elongata]
MSHEGIRMVSAAEAARAEKLQLGGAAIQPAKVKIDKTGGTGMRIEWKDGHVSEWPFAWLRAACPCANCHEEREAAHREPGIPKPKPQSLLPMYEAPSRPLEITPIGKYAVKFHWNDGHEAGIYSWDYLRNVCDTAWADQLAQKAADAKQ